jgi:hypothetical protein
MDLKTIISNIKHSLGYDKRLPDNLPVSPPSIYQNFRQAKGSIDNLAPLETGTNSFGDTPDRSEKFCKDCKHYTRTSASLNSMLNQQIPYTAQPRYEHACYAGTTRDLVSGEHTAYDARKRRSRNLDSCGPTGKLWEAKNP